MIPLSKLHSSARARSGFPSPDGSFLRATRRHKVVLFRPVGTRSQESSKGLESSSEASSPPSSSTPGDSVPPAPSPDSPLPGATATATAEPPADAGSDGAAATPPQLDDLLRALRPVARLDQELLDEVMTLPGTKNMSSYLDRTDALAAWKQSLSKGILPDPKGLDWPQEPFKSSFVAALKELEMARFCRRYPALLDTLLRQMLGLVRVFEEKLAEEEAKKQQKQQQQQQQQQQQSSSQQSKQEQSQGGGPNQSGDQGDQEGDSEQQGESDGGAEGQEGEPNKTEIGLESESMEQEQGQGDQDSLENMTKQLLENFKKEWEPVMDNVEAAAKAFDDLGDLMDGPEGFDLTTSLWKKTGWREVEDLRKKLENLKELRLLVRELGRAGGKGPKRRAPEEVESMGGIKGLVRSPLVPEETRGLTRSGDISRMLPSEMALLAAGWPRQKGAWEDNLDLPEHERDGSAPSTSGGVRRGSVGARRLHLVRRAERSLLSYERTGWLEDEPSRLTGRREIRPAAEMGPIILCLDTSGSMRGSRETVAKALALEVLRGANRQGRLAFLYAFSGPGQVQELELRCEPKSMARLLDFLAGSFEGGTDVDAPLERSLERLRSEEWGRADILMVTDGEIHPPSPLIIESIADLNARMGLEVHGLLVGRGIPEPMKQLCTKIHIFKSWTAVGGRGDAY